jgi:Fe-S-cluster containining protein
VEDRFACLPHCGLCCSYRVLVTEADRQRLRAGALPAASEPWETTAEGTLALQRAPDFCLFLDPSQRCLVYDRRPEQCRTYPYLWTRTIRSELDVDLSCPGLGRGGDTPAELRRPPEESASQQARRRQVVGEIQGLLRAQRRYASPEALIALGQRFLDALSTGWGAEAPRGVPAPHAVEWHPPFRNLESADDLPIVWEEGSVGAQGLAPLLADRPWMERHFGRPRWNTQVGRDGGVDVYRFWIVADTFHVEARSGACATFRLDSETHLPWQPEALATRRAYLERWLRRQLLLRLSSNLALASPSPVAHVAVCALEFLLDVDRRLAVLAAGLARASGKDGIDRALALEAIRASDGLLRAWCESARVGTTT